MQGAPAPFMRAIELPDSDPDELALRLFEGFRIEVPVYEWGGIAILRFSIGPYNDETDVERLVGALRKLL